MRRARLRSRTRRGAVLVAVGIVAAALVAVGVLAFRGSLLHAAVAGPHASAPTSVPNSAPTTTTPAPTATATSAPIPSTPGIPPAQLGAVPATEGPSAPDAPQLATLARTWSPPPGMPDAGLLIRVEIPGVLSHFPARTALLYLPPAALIPDAPYLPVVTLLSGQSSGASPDDLEKGGHIRETMDQIAAEHNGLAPIVVVPDQLSVGSKNPMCVDGPLGNSYTYLTADVPNWIRAHLRVDSGASAWTIGGFSQGGTCALQLGTGRPDEYGNFIDVSGQLAPTLGTTALTVKAGFKGDWSAYRAALPETQLNAHAPYAHENAFLAAGQDDHTYGPNVPIVDRLASAAGIHTMTYLVPDAGHNWGTASQALGVGLRWLMPLIGLAPGGQIGGVAAR